MNDVLAGRTLVIILALIIGIWLVRDMSWEDKWHRFWFRFFCVTALIRGIGWLAFDVLGLFPFD